MALPSWSDVEKLLHWLSPRFMLFVLLLSAGLFFMPPAWAAYLSLDEWICHHRFWTGMGMFVSTAYLIPFGIAPIVEKSIAVRRQAKRVAYKMENLTDDEKAQLRRFYFPRNVDHVIVWKHEIGKLEADGILFRPGDSGLSNRQEVYCITDSVLEYIAKHKDFVQKLEHADPSIY